MTVQYLLHFSFLIPFENLGLGHLIIFFSDKAYVMVSSYMHLYQRRQELIGVFFFVFLFFGGGEVLFVCFL